MKQLVLLGIGLGLFFLPCSAAELPVGDWSGSYSFADDETLQVKYVVSKQQQDETATWQISMLAVGEAFEFSDIKLLTDQLQFRMNPGEEVECLLDEGEGGIYKGECHSVADPTAAQVIKIFMRPPSKADDVDGSDADGDVSVADQPT